MDEVMFRTSQKVDNIQHQLIITANESKNALVQFSERAKESALQMLENPKYKQALDAAKNVIIIVIKYGQECKKHVIANYHPKFLVRKLLRLLGTNFSKRDILIGTTGLLIGIVLGFSISYFLPREEEVLRCMQAIQCLRYSGIEAVTFVEDALGPRECGKNEVLVNVKAASVNAIDIEICKGYGSLLRSITRKFYKHCKEELPITLGRDCTGIVVDIGRNISRLEIGDEVWLTTAFWAPGTMAEYIVVTENKISRKPKTIGFEGAASLPYCGSMALLVIQKLDITSDNAMTKNIFVHGGCTAAGCILVQILLSWGAKITTTCYKRAIPVAKALGVKDVIGLSPLSSKKLNLEEDNVTLLNEELCKREKFDAIITTTMCELTIQELSAFCKSNGKIVSTLPELLRSDSSTLFMRAIYSIRFNISSYIQKIFTGTLNNFGEDAMCYHTLEQLTDLVENGKIQTVVDRVFQPHDIEHALNHIESSGSIGSTVITFR